MVPSAPLPLPRPARPMPCPAAPVSTAAPPVLSPALRWLIYVIAAIGFAFDTYELLMLSLIVRPALHDLGGLIPGSAAFSLWLSLLFYLPAVCGGIFGLLGGTLIDRIGRKRVLTLSILLYALASFASGFSTSLPMLLALRCLVFIGFCVEFVAAVAWLAELFPEHRKRESVLGITQTFSSLGALMLALVSGVITAWAAAQPGPLAFGLTLPAVTLPPVALPEALGWLGPIENPRAGWRYTLMSGVIPALPLILVRPWLPESPLWRDRHRAGTLPRPKLAALFAPDLRRTTLVTSVMVTLSFVISFAAVQQMPQLVPGLPDVRAEVAQAQAQAEAAGRHEPPRRIAAPIEEGATAEVMKGQGSGSICSRILFVGLTLLILSRQRLLRLLLVPGVVLMPVSFGWLMLDSVPAAQAGAFLVSLLVVAQFSYWGNYLPRVFPLHLRGTGESFAVNVGGRMCGAAFIGLSQALAYWLPVGDDPVVRLSYAIGIVATLAYLANLAMSFRLPEPAVGQDLSR